MNAECASRIKNAGIEFIDNGSWGEHMANAEQIHQSCEYVMEKLPRKIVEQAHSENIWFVYEDKRVWIGNDDKCKNTLISQHGYPVVSNAGWMEYLDARTSKSFQCAQLADL